VRANPANDTVVRLTQQQIVLHGAMFILYDHCRKLDPDYEMTPSEWLMLVVHLGSFWRTTSGMNTSRSDGAPNASTRDAMIGR